MNKITEQIGQTYSEQYNKIGLVLPQYSSDYQIGLIKKVIPNSKNTHILDAGCGNGAYANVIKLWGYNNIKAVDLFNEIQNKEINYTKASIDNLPFNAESFDFIYSLSVIYYLPSIEKTFEELYRVLKPGGLLIVTGHTKFSLFTLWRLLLRRLFNKKYQHLNGAKFNSCQSYIKLAQKQGFELIYRDGFILSFLILPVVRIGKKHFKLIEESKSGILDMPKTLNNNLIKATKSEIGYHFAIVLKKS